MKFAKGFLAAAMTFIITSSSLVYAASYSDVPTSHWAYESIVKMADSGIMVGNISGEYKPDSAIDKFDTAKIFAIAAGYKYTGLTAQEQNYYDQAYEKNKSILTSYNTKFSKWNATTDREIAFLLEKEIFDESDLSQFVVMNGTTESLRALSRQEAAVFLVKLMGKKSEALSGTYSNAFDDDDKISPANKSYVYYLRNQGVISGDTDNTFNPNGVVTKAALAVMLDKTLEKTDTKTLNMASEGSNVATIETISGTIDAVHTSLNAVQIKDITTGTAKIYKVDATALITVDGFIKTIGDLSVNMPVVGILNNGNIVDLKAQSAVEQASGNNSQSSDTSAKPQTTDKTSIDEIVYKTVQGTVKAIDQLNQTLNVEISIINPKGGIISEVTTYTASSDIIILRGEKSVDFSDILVNDIVTATVSGEKIYRIELEEKSRQFVGTVLEKVNDTVLGTQYYIIEDNKGNTNQLRITTSTELTRKGMGSVGFNDIRIGDTIDLVTEYSTIVEAYAYGEKSNVEGVIQEIHITQDDSYIVLKHDTGGTETFLVIDGSFDLYTLRVGEKVRLRLDSREVESATVTQKSSTDYFTGYIQSVGNRYITVSETTSSSSATERIYYDSSTVFTDGTTGNKVSVGSLSNGMKIFAVYKSNSTDAAKTITILQK